MIRALTYYGLARITWGVFVEGLTGDELDAWATGEPFDEYLND